MAAKRIIYLDGLRGVAILNVIFFHAYSRWGDLETFEKSDVLRLFFSYSFLGVNLFFAISGYVIYMSLKRSDNILTFSFARYMRLAPAMIVVSIFLYFTSFFIPERPQGISNLQDLLPSITFINPQFLSKIFGIHIRSLDGAFWSIYVEVGFYFVSSILFFILRDRQLTGILVLFILYLIFVILVRIGFNNIYFLLAKKILSFLGAGYYGWFLIGIYSYKYAHSHLTWWRKYSLFFIFIITVLAESMRGGLSIEVLIASVVTALFFVYPLFSMKFKLILSAPILLFFGFISYPLYLIHQNLVTGLAIKLHNSGFELPNFLYPLPFLIMVIYFSFLIAKLEPLIKFFFLNRMPTKLFGIKFIQK